MKKLPVFRIISPTIKAKFSQLYFTNIFIQRERSRNVLLQTDRVLLSQTGFHLSATVVSPQAGQSKGAYNVAVMFDRCRITSCSCTCGAGAKWCAHVVALCLFRIHNVRDFRCTLCPLFRETQNISSISTVSWYFFYYQNFITKIFWILTLNLTVHASFSLFIHLNYANTRLKLIFKNIDNLVFLSKSEN